MDMKKNVLLLVFILITLSSCAIKKNSSKTKTDRETKEQTEVIEKRKGDTVTYVIPKIKLKDTTIYTVNKQGTTLRTVYDSNSNISQIECFSSLIDVITKSNREVIETIKEKEKDKEEKASSSIVLYLVIGAIIVFAILILSLHLQIKSLTKI